MKSLKIFYAIIFFALVVISCNSQTSTPVELPVTANSTLVSDSLTIGNAIAYKNLQIFPILSIKAVKSQAYITLTQAIEQGLVEVKETGEVNQLSISNKSDKHVFILAGDIVKGGKQDRTMENDAIIAPNSKDIPLNSYCVESGRWQSRGEEEVDKFSENSKVLASKDLKLACRYKKDQSEVWAKVALKQEKLNRKISQMEGNEVETRSSESQTSLQLTLESKELEKYVLEYENQMQLERNMPNNAVGFVYVVNNEVYGADIFNSKELFESVKEKLIEATLIEAIADADSLPVLSNIAVEVVVDFLAISKTSENSSQKINRSTTANEFDAREKVLFETVNSADSGKWVRKNYVSKLGMSDENRPVKR